MYIYDRLNDVARISYPFKEDCVLAYESGASAVVIPNDVFIDMEVSAYVGTAADCYLERFVKLTPSAVSMTWSLCGAETTVLTTTADTTGVIEVNAAAGITAKIKLDAVALSDFLSGVALGSPYIRVDDAGGLIEPSCVVYSPGGVVTSIKGDAEDSTAITGAINIIDGINTRVQLDTAKNAVLIIAAPNIGVKNCNAFYTEDGDVSLKKFNGATADDKGNAQVSTDSKITLKPSEDGKELVLDLSDAVKSILDCEPEYEIPEEE